MKWLKDELGRLVDDRLSDVSEEMLEREEEELTESLKRMGSRSSRRMKEAGRGAEGEISADAMKRWFIWAGAAIGICLLCVCLGGLVAGARNKKEAVILEVDSWARIEMRLNRKGKALTAVSDDLENPSQFEGKSLTEGIVLLLDVLSETENEGKTDDRTGTKTQPQGVLLTLRPASDGVKADLEEMAEQIGVLAETVLRKNQGNTVVYISTLEEDEEIRTIAEKYGISYSRAALVKNLVDKNTKLKLKDIDRLAGMETDGLVRLMERNRYSTSFRQVTAAAVYEEKPEGENAGRQAGAESEDETESLENGESGVSGESGANAEAESSEGDGSAQEETARNEEASAVGSESSENTEDSGAETAEETTAPEPESAVPETMAETTASESESAAPAPAPETMAEPTEAEPVTEPEPEPAVSPQEPGDGSGGPGSSEAPGNGNPAGSVGPAGPAGEAQPPAAIEPLPPSPAGGMEPITVIPVNPGSSETIGPGM